MCVCVVHACVCGACNVIVVVYIYIYGEAGVGGRSYISVLVYVSCVLLICDTNITVLNWGGFSIRPPLRHIISNAEKRCSLKNYI